MKLKDFAKEHNLDNQTVSRYINRHKELFNQHAIKEGQNIILDDVALEILGKKYPFPEPVVVQDQAAREKLLEVTEKYAAAMEKITLLTEQNAQLLVIQSKQRFLEEENKNLTHLHWSWEPPRLALYTTCPCPSPGGRAPTARTAGPRTMAAADTWARKPCAVR